MRRLEAEVFVVRETVANYADRLKRLLQDDELQANETAFDKTGAAMVKLDEAHEMLSEALKELL